MREHLLAHASPKQGRTRRVVDAASLAGLDADDLRGDFPVPLADRLQQLWRGINAWSLAQGRNGPLHTARLDRLDVYATTTDCQSPIAAVPHRDTWAKHVVGVVFSGKGRLLAEVTRSDQLAERLYVPLLVGDGVPFIFSGDRDTGLLHLTDPRLDRAANRLLAFFDTQPIFAPLP